MSSTLISRSSCVGRRITLCLIALASLSSLAGCSNYRWTSDFQSAEDYAHQQKKYLFIFYKWWLSNDSNRMHGDVLSDPAVSLRLSDTINVLLEKESSPDYARYLSKYGVTTAPAFVIVAPDGSYQVRTGFVPKDRFIEFIESAKTARPSRPGTHGGSGSNAPSSSRPPPAQHKPALVP